MTALSRTWIVHRCCARIEANLHRGQVRVRRRGGGIPHALGSAGSRSIGFEVGLRPPAPILILVKSVSAVSSCLFQLTVSVTAPVDTKRTPLLPPVRFASNDVALLRSTVVGRS